MFVRNPNANKFVAPYGYIDLGWQLHIGNSEDVKRCHDLGHKRVAFDNSIYLYRCTDTIYTCDECKNYYHIDCSD